MVGRFTLSDLDAIERERRRGEQQVDAHPRVASRERVAETQTGLGEAIAVIAEQLGAGAAQSRQVRVPDDQHRTLLAHEADDTRARLAVDIFCYHTAKWIGAFAAALGGLDTLVFSAGIGERSPEIRRRVLARLEFLGACCDAEANARNAGVISTMSSAVSIRVIPTDEAVVMARQARDVLNSSQASSDSPEAHS